MNLSTQQKEEWRPIAGYEGSYEVSNLGRVKSLDRVVSQTRWSGKMIRRGKILSPKRTRGNPKYCNAALFDSKNKQRKEIAVHRLVATAFIPNQEKRPMVNHKDSNPSNNHVSNLEWCTAKENTKHSFLSGHRTPASGEKHGMSVLSEKDVQAIRLLYKTLRYSRRRMAELFCVSTATIDKIIKNKGWKHI